MSKELEILKQLTKERQLLLLYLLYAKDREPIRGDLWLQKEMFLIEKISEIRDRYYFLEHFKGPFSEDLIGDVNYLISLNLVEKTGRNVYKITNKGINLIESLMNKNILVKLLDKRTLDAAEEVKELLNDLNNEELLGYIYFNYPETTYRSEELEKINKRKLQIVLSLYRKGKISLSRAAELLNIPINKLIDILRSAK